MYTYLRLLLEDAELGPEGTPPWRFAVDENIIVYSYVNFQSNKRSDSDSDNNKLTKYLFGETSNSQLNDLLKSSMEM